jgi:hypothetical protein
MSDDQIVASPQSLAQLFGRFDFKNPVGGNIAANMFSTWERTKDKKEIIPLTKLQGLTINTFWSEVWSNNTALLLDYHNARKERDMTCSKWEFHPDKSTGYRILTLQTVVEVPRAGTYTPLHEAHRFAFSIEGGRPKLFYQISSQTPDVPAGTTFRCETLMEITADSLDSECSINIFANTKKMSIAFAPIQFIATPRAVRELQAAYVMLLGVITSKLCGAPLQLKPTLTESITAVAEPTPTVQPAVYAVAASEQSHQQSGRGDGLPQWMLYALIVLVVCVSLLMTWAVLSVSSANQNLGEILRTAKSVLPSGGSGGGGATASTSGGSSLWDLVDRELNSDLVDLATTAATRTGGADGAAQPDPVLTKTQLSILAKQEALFGRAMSALVDVQERQDALERQQSWLTSLCFSQLMVLIVVVVKVFFISA